MVFDSESFNQNCKNFAEFHYKARDILSTTDGKKSYKHIAKEHSVNGTTVSSILKYAEKLGLAKKIKAGIYKKLPGVMKHIPKTKNKNDGKTTVSQIINKVSSKKRKNKEGNVKYKAGFKTKIDKMSKAYEQLFATENTLRELIRKVLSNEKDWWKNKIPKGVKDSIEDTMSKLPYDSPKRIDNLEYTHLGQLAEIMISKKNWKEFEPFLKKKITKQTFQETVNRAIPVRNAIGHCIPLSGDDFRLCDMRFIDILKMLIR